MCDFACIAGFVVVGVIAVAMVLNCEGIFCFDANGLRRHRARRPYRAED